MIDEDAILLAATDHVRSDETMLAYALREEATDDELQAIHRMLHATDHADAGRIMAKVLVRAENHAIRQRYEVEYEKALEEEGERKRNAERWRLGPTESEAR